MPPPSSAGATMRLARRPQAFLRRRQPTTMRFASTGEKAEEAAAKAKSTVSNMQSKASEGLSKVTSSAGPAIAGAGKAVGRNLSKIGGRTGRLIAMVENAIPPTIYYSKVGFELSKLVFRGQKMAPPSLETFQSYFSPILNNLRNPQALLRSAPSANVSPDQAISRVRGMNRGQIIAGAVIFAEVLGFFTVGEMLGRMKLVGYRGEVHHEH